MHVGALARFAAELPCRDERRDDAIRATVDLGENAPFRLLTFKNCDGQRVALYVIKLPRIRLYFHVSARRMGPIGLMRLIGPMGRIGSIGPTSRIIQSSICS